MNRSQTSSLLKARGFVPLGEAAALPTGLGLSPRSVRSNPLRFTGAGLWLFVFALVWLSLPGLAADKLPPAPARYFNDNAKMVSAAMAQTLNAKLEQFERDTSNQIIVATFPKLDTDLEMTDFTQRTFDSWKVGQAKLNNGLVLFVFAQDRKTRIEVGYGLEGAVPDITAKQILDNELRPSLKAGQNDQAFANTVEALMKAARGEYKGTGRTANERKSRRDEDSGLLGFVLPFVVIFLLSYIFSPKRRGTMFGPRGRRGYRTPPMIFWGGGGGGWGGGGGGGFGGGGFSGGGGSSGGGGASGDW